MDHEVVLGKVIATRRLEFVGPSGVAEVAGQDSMQALLLTLHVLSVELDALARKHHGTFCAQRRARSGLP
jgi:hypothetical protein